MFKHNICGDQPEVPDGMLDYANPLPLEFFASPRCPPILTASETTVVKVHWSKVPKEPEESALVGDLDGTS